MLIKGFLFLWKWSLKINHLQDDLGRRKTVTLLTSSRYLQNVFSTSLLRQLFARRRKRSYDFLTRKRSYDAKQEKNRSYSLKTFKGCLPQNLLSPLLSTVSLIFLENMSCWRWPQQRLGFSVTRIWFLISDQRIS